MVGSSESVVEASLKGVGRAATGCESQDLVVGTSRSRLGDSCTALLSGVCRQNHKDMAHMRFYFDIGGHASCKSKERSWDTARSIKVLEPSTYWVATTRRQALLRMMLGSRHRTCWISREISGKRAATCSAKHEEPVTSTD